LLPRTRREEDDYYWKKWIRQQPEWECLATGMRGDDIDGCHLRSRGAGGSDYWIFPLKHELHMALDHSPRGPSHGVKESRLREEMSLWYYRLPQIHLRYFNEQTAERQAELLTLDTFQMMRETCLLATDDDPIPQEGDQ